MIYLELFLGFLKVGFFSFGGAYGAIPLIRDVVLEYGWLSDEKIAYMIAVSESTPGPIMINLATFVGNTQGGVLGAIIATLAVVLPSFFIIIIVTAAMKTLLKNRYVEAALDGLKPCITGIIAATGIYMIINNCVKLPPAFAFDYKALIITIVLAAVLIISKYVFKKKPSPILLILISAAIGIGIYSF